MCIKISDFNVHQISGPPTFFFFGSQRLLVNPPHRWHTLFLQSWHKRPMPSANFVLKHRRQRRRSMCFRRLFPLLCARTASSYRSNCCWMVLNIHKKFYINFKYFLFYLSNLKLFAFFFFASGSLIYCTFIILHCIQSQFVHIIFTCILLSFTCTSIMWNPYIYCTLYI